ncbi:MAG TPA: hypothetical protein VGZ90_06650 [Puia sp.]|jgi:hypothetical protein|nr:hypothetical protein [Puia sp.]
MTSDIISVIANLALALSFIVGLIFGIVQVRAAARDRRERLTLETLREFQTREFVELLHYISFHDLPSNREGLMALPPDERTLLIQFGQEMESLGILVAERLIDIDLVDKTLGSFVTISWDKYKEMFMDIREKQPDPYLGEYFQWLAERIDERMRMNPREPFYKTSKSSLNRK